MTKNVIVSTHPLPYDGIGSWTTMYNAYLTQFEHKIDYIVSPHVKHRAEGVKYVTVKEPTVAKDRLSLYIKHYKYKAYWHKLKSLINQYDQLIVQIIDNTGMLKAIDYFAKKANVRHKIKILFFIHGYDYNFSNTEREKFYESIDDLIVLTKSSYEYQLEKAQVMPCEVSHIYNGIDSNIFHPSSVVERKKIRKILKMDENKIYFLWLSQDRPKKGLHIILRAWEKLVKRNANIELVIIGTHDEVKGKQIKWLGRIPNNELPMYYQAMDFYLFSTLWHEGFGLSLAEAMKCGAVCIASKIDPVPEVMGYGKYGRLVDFPHSPQSWVDAIEEEIEKYQKNERDNPYQKNIPDKIYDLDQWCKNINTLIEKWKNYSL